MQCNYNWSLACKLARRELRAGLKGFRIFLGCLGIGVAAIAGVGTISASVTAGLNGQAKSLLGGDIDLRSHNNANSPEQDQYLNSNSIALSKTQELRAMASPVYTQTNRARVRSLIELKGVARFKSIKELDTLTKYRILQVNYDNYIEDLENKKATMPLNGYDQAANDHGFLMRYFMTYTTRDCEVAGLQS